MSPEDMSHKVFAILTKAGRLRYADGHEAKFITDTIEAAIRECQTAPATCGHEFKFCKICGDEVLTE